MKKRLMDLDVAVINALELFSGNIPDLNLGDYKRPLVVGSGNAIVTGKILFEDKDAVFADESNYKSKLKNIKGIDGAVLISASGGKHSPGIAKFLKKKGIEFRMLTCNENAEAKKFVDEDKFFVFPKNVEPYTYNTSTYLGMILAKTKENPEKILDFLRKIEKKIPKNLEKYDAYYFILPEKFSEFSEMILTKFDELFQPKISCRAFTSEASKHAKSVVVSDNELFVGVGYDNKIFGTKRFNLPLPKNADYGAVMAVSYFFIGKIQKQNPDYFKKGIEKYCKKASKIFGSKIEPVVE